MSPEICPQCGALVPRNAQACPECGADETTGWSDTAYASRLGIPDENFEYDRFVKEEFAPAAGRVKPRGIHWIWWLTAVGLIVLFLLFFLR